MSSKATEPWPSLTEVTTAPSLPERVTTAPANGASPGPVTVAATRYPDAANVRSSVPGIVTARATGRTPGAMPASV